MLSGAARAGAAAPDDAGDFAVLRDFTRTAMREARVRGAAVAYLRAGKDPWVETFGVADERRADAVTRDTVFEAASLGKVVAAYAALLRVTDGTWSLDMPVRSPRMPIRPGCEPPTLAALLSHSAGLGNDLGAERFEAACHPPAAFSYAGQGYLVLQDLFDASGESAEDFARRRIFTPLGMRSASFATPSGANAATGHVDLLYGLLTGKVLGPARAAGYAALVSSAALLAGVAVRTRRRMHTGRAAVAIAFELLAGALLLVTLASCLVVPVAPWSRRVMLPSSLHASIDDLARFAAELLNPSLMSAEQRDRLLAAHVRIDGELSWGAGIGVERTGDVTSYWQWGSNPGFQGLLVLVPARGEALVVLTNTGGFADVVLGTTGGYAMAKRVARRALGIPARWDLHRGAP